MTLDVFGLKLHEFDVAGTDLLLCLEAVFFSVLLAHEQTAHPKLRSFVATLFAWLALSSLLGAVFHAFFPEKAATSGGYLVWMLTGISIGLTASAVWCINAYLMNHRVLKNVLPSLVPVYLLAFIYVLFFVDYHYRTIIAFYAPPVVILAILAVWTWLKHRTADWLYLVLGTGLSFAAAVVQVLKIGLHPVYFNFNALYHLIQGVALVFLFVSFRLLLRRARTG